MILADPESAQDRRPRFDPIRIVVLVVTLVAFLALVLLIALLSSGKKKRRPQWSRLVVPNRAVSQEMARQMPMGDSLRDVA
ncbi:MAG: hypothetical protein ABI759_32605 [Candidatus Solibacter sp.]